MIVKVQVTAGDIAEGKPEEACACPVWLAICRAMPGVLIAVGPDDISVGEDRESVRLPWPAREFISLFDELLPVLPFEFDLDVPDALLAGDHR